ncbi:MAG TPA: hypothetical protein EYN69_03155 [Flavobacteriales bacterium]|nr:hypothetical protein [Flavobacteriales bacterium]
MVKISAVNYLNTKPFVYGIQHSGYLEDFELQLDIPSVCATKVINHEVDIGLVPIAILPELAYKEILTDYCIGAKGAVGSVLLLSQEPLDKIENIILDFHSNTSISLVKVLCSKYWNINPSWINSTKDFDHLIKGTTAGVLIGDRSMKIRSQFDFVYDLAFEWEQFSKMPFVFACWVCNRKLPEQFVSNFEKAISWGVANKLASIAGVENYQEAKDYVENNISYDLDAAKKSAMKLFLSYLRG